MQEPNPDSAARLHAMGSDNHAHNLAEPAPLVPLDAPLLPLYTHYGTLVFADIDAFRLRHGSASSVPHNLFWVSDGVHAFLVRVAPDGRRWTVGVRPEGQFAGQMDKAGLDAKGRTQKFALLSDEDGVAFGFAAAGMLLCAEPSGTVGLSRVQLGAWELFRSDPANEPERCIASARQAGTAGDWPEAARRWNDFCQRFPELPAGPIGRSRALREGGELAKASEVIRSALQHFPQSSRIAAQAANIMEAQGLKRDAADLFRRAIELEPGNPSNYVTLSRALRGMSDFRQAEEVLAEGLVKTEGSLHVLLELARLSERKGDWREASERFRSCSLMYPNEPAAIIGLAHALASQGLLSDAGAILTGAMERFPARFEFARAFVQLPRYLGLNGFPDYLKRAREILAKYPDLAESCCVVADAMLTNRLEGEAEDFLRTCLERFPMEKSLWHLLATVLVRQAKWHAAFDVFARITKAHPRDPTLIRDYARALIAAKNWDDAESIIHDARTWFPTDVSFDTLLLDILLAQGEVAEATGLWRALNAESADKPALREELFQRRGLFLGLGVDPAESDKPAAPAIGESARNDIAIDDIVTSFESLGGAGYGCEFGLVQRFYGAEPLGLLRWTEMEPHELLEALEARFEGVGTPDQTILREPAHGLHDEYGAGDRRFGMRMHTFVRADQVPPDKMFSQICRRLTYLRQKLLDDLREGNKIFVYKDARKNLSNTEVTRLSSAVRRYGNSTLLYVRRQDETTRFPDVVSPEPGLLIGTIDKFYVGSDGAVVGLPVTSWAAVMGNAYRLWR